MWGRGAEAQHMTCPACARGGGGWLHRVHTKDGQHEQLRTGGVCEAAVCRRSFRAYTAVFFRARVVRMHSKTSKKPYTLPRIRRI